MFNTSDLEAFVGMKLAMDPAPTPEGIRHLIKQLAESLEVEANEALLEGLARHMEQRHGVTMTIGAVLTGDTYEPWLDQAKKDIEPYYWDRYRKLLIQNGLSGQVIATMDDVTDRTLGYLENPLKQGEWDRRGMVVGHVQSGKTANYAGLICKAADAGYKLIVVIAGIHNNLRSQTQARIDEGFVGRDSANMPGQDRFIGVGKLDKRKRPITFTNTKSDFKKSVAEAVGVPLVNLKEPAVLVVKKNSTTLNNLIDWLVGHNKDTRKTIDVPILVIDDEADNASINVKHGQGAISKINSQLRGLLKLFSRSCYIGYTATPFANIFIDPNSTTEMLGDDLFPRDFIVSLDPPSNYFGAKRIFSDEPQAYIRHISDNEGHIPLVHKAGTQVTSLPPSLIDAVRAFIVARAIRLARGHIHTHCSMLVNASRLTDVQRQIRNEVHHALQGIRASIRLHAMLDPTEAIRDPEIASLHRVWNAEYTASWPDWPKLLRLLHDSVAPIKVVEVNSRSPGALSYTENAKAGLSVIAVGGFSLSRGLTLEGLMISYFLRNSMMYDTLMQMGRWFGYRPNYEDLCRIWMSESASGWYSHISDSIEMLRDELRDMEAMSATPKDFGLKVRSHPDTLLVTAKSKMGSGKQIVVEVGLSNSFVECTSIHRADDLLKRNFETAIIFISDLQAASGQPLIDANGPGGGFLLIGIPASCILSFFSNFKNNPASLISEPAPIQKYINQRLKTELFEWDVLIPGGSADCENTQLKSLLGPSFRLPSRKEGANSDSKTIRIGNKHRVASGDVEKYGLDPDVIQKIEADYRSKNRDATSTPPKIYRKERVRPLFVLHFLDLELIQHDDEDHKTLPVPAVAWSISLPETKMQEKTVEYIVNTTWLRENMAVEFDDEEMGGDDV